jgi:predicted site-specific integrase-resolvase
MLRSRPLECRIRSQTELEPLRRNHPDENPDRMLPDGKADKSGMAKVGYARVSTADQDPALQHDALAAAGCKKVFEDGASGAHADRGGLQAALDYV